MIIHNNGWLALLGGFSIHLYLGCVYLWGSIVVYVTSYLRIYDSSITLDDTFIALPIMVITQCISLPFGAYLLKKLHPAILILIGSCIGLTGAFIASYTKNFYLFMIFYPVIYGLSNGIVYMAPLAAGWSYFPQKKGMVSGIIVGGFGFGSFIFGFIAQAITNPDNLPATIKVGKNKYFDKEVAENVPLMFHVLILCHGILVIIGIYLVKKKDVPKTISDNTHSHIAQTPEAVIRNDVERRSMKTAHQENSEPEEAAKVMGETANDCPNLRTGLKTFKFWHLYIMCAFSIFYGLYIVNVTKTFGMQKINDDSYLTIVAAIAAAANGGSRFLWASLQDKFGFKKIYIIILVLEILLSSTIYYIAEVKGLYLIWVALSLSCQGAHYSMFPAAVSKFFGLKVGPQLYSVFFSVFGVSAFIGYLINKNLVSEIGYEPIFWISAIMATVSLVMAIFFKNEPYMHTKHKKSPSLLASDSNTF